MTRRQLMHALAESGHRIGTATLDYAIANGHIPEPPVDGSGRRVYSDEHIAGIVQYVERNKSRRKQPV